MRFVITGTDTGIGKTVFAAALTHALSAYYWKPIQSGLAEIDSETVINLGGLPPTQVLPEVYKLTTPVSPHLSARLDSVVIDTNALSLPNSQRLVIEGAGGILVPLTEEKVFADVFAQWQIPTILCARTRLGTINHTLLSLEALRARAIPIHGVVFIGDAEAETETIISKLGQVTILGRLPLLNPLTKKNLHHAFLKHFHLDDFL